MRHAVALAFVLAVAVAAPAQAAFTGSTVTAPASGAFLKFDNDHPTTETVTGTVTGATAGDKADIACVGSKTAVLMPGVDVSSASFSVSVSLQDASRAVCRLRAVPAGADLSGDLSAYSGPLVSVDGGETSVTGGKLWDFYVYGFGFSGTYDSNSVAGCAIDDSYLYDPATLASTTLFYCNAYFNADEGGAGVRSELQIDGKDAFLPGNTYTFADFPTRTGFQSPVYSVAENTTDGSITITDSELPMLCDAPATYPPTAANCPSFHASGVRIDQTVTILPPGLVARVVQTFSSTDGASHVLDADFEQDINGAPSGYRFPGEAAFAEHTAGDTVSLPAGPGSIFAIKKQGTAASFQNPIGAITYSRAPALAKFLDADTFVMRYADTVTASAPVTYRWGFADGASPAAVDALETANRDVLIPPTVSIDSPAPGLVVTAPAVAVQGHVSDNVGVASVTVNGVAASVSGDTYSGGAALVPGTNAITVVARDAAGNATSVGTSVVYTPPSAPPPKPVTCKVPSLKRKTLHQAKSMLKKAHCGVGKVRKVRSRKVRKGRVIASKPGPRAIRPQGTKVALTVSRGH